MERGYYWLCLKNEEPEVVEIDGNAMYLCGSDVSCYFEDGEWHEGLFTEVMDVVSIIGPLAPPNPEIPCL